MRRYHPLIVVAAALAAGCADRAEHRDPVETGLARDCAELEATIRKRAVAETAALLDRDTYALTGPSELTAVPSTTQGGASEYTTTNTQERGVDEPDVVKNDGSRILVLHGRDLAIFAAWPPEATRLVSRTTIEGTPIEMVYDGQHVAVFSHVRLDGILSRVGETPAPTANAHTVPCPYVASRSGTCPTPANGLKITLLDVAPAEPRVLNEHFIEGRYVTARRVESRVYVVSSSPVRFPDALYHYPERAGGGISGRDREWERVRRKSAIESRRIQDWLPRFVEHSPDGFTRLVPLDCSNVYVPPAPSRLGFTTITTLSLELHGTVTSRASLLSEVDDVYASRASIYLATHSDWRESYEIGDRTHLHRFDVSATTGRVSHVASGDVPGHVADPFSMDDEGGYLRVATTASTSGPAGPPAPNAVYVLRPDGHRLVPVGELTGLAPGERLYAARFEGRRGFLVTFKVVDPLFTLDLSAPADPRVAGELKVPGFSTYLHPLGDSDLLAVGRQVSDDGRVRGGLMLQIFDVSDLAHPQLRHRLIKGSSSSSSDAEYEHKAFNYFASRNLLAIPYTRAYSYAPAGSTLELFRVAVADGLFDLGAIDHTDLVRDDVWRSGLSPSIRRSVMMEKYVYSISNGGLKVHCLDSLAQPVAAIRLPATYN